MQHRLLTEALLRGFGTAQELATAGGVSSGHGQALPPRRDLSRRADGRPADAHSRLVVDAMLRMAGLDDLSLDQEQARLAA